MLFRTLIDILEAEYERRTGVLPDRPWQRWLWEPWVGEFLRTCTPPQPQVAVVRKTTS